MPKVHSENLEKNTQDWGKAYFYLRRAFAQKTAGFFVIALIIGALGYFSGFFGGAPANSVNPETAGIGVLSGNSQKPAKTYTNEKYSFSFLYAADLPILEQTYEEESHLITLDNGGKRRGFQVFITPFDEAEPLTKERILQDVPDIIIKDPKEVIVTQNKVPALIFLSNDPNFGDTREVWFSYKGDLYQITSYIEFEQEIIALLETWKFSD